MQPATNSPQKAIRSTDALGKTTKRHNFMQLDGSQVVIVGFDTKESDHAEDGAWILCSPESNNAPVDPKTLASIEATGKVSIAGKVVRIPLTKETQHRAFVDSAGQRHDFYLAVVYARKRARALRQIQAEGGPTIQMTFEVAAKSETLESLAIEMLIENLVRRVMRPMSEAREIDKLAQTGLSRSEIAAKLGEAGAVQTEATILNKMRLLDLVPEVQELVESGELGTTCAYRIARLDKPRQAKLALLAIANNMTAKQVEATVAEMLLPSAPSPQIELLPGEDLTVPHEPASGSEPDAVSLPAPSSQLEAETPHEKPSAPERPAAPDTRHRKPKVAEIEEMIARLQPGEGGQYAAMAAAVEALRWALGLQTDDQLIGKVAPQAQEIAA